MEQDFLHLFKEKNKEILGIHEQQVCLMKEEISDQRKKALAISNVFLQLQEDFSYNLVLLDERDAELEEYDNLLGSAQIALKEKEEIISQLQAAFSRLNADYMKEKDKNLVLEKAISKKILALEQEVDYSVKLKKQEYEFQVTIADLKKQLQEKQDICQSLHELVSTHYKTVKEKLQIVQSDSDTIKGKLKDMESKCICMEKGLISFFEEKSRKFQDLGSDLTKLKKDFKVWYEQNSRTIDDRNRCLDNQLKVLIGEAEKINILTLRLDVAKNRTDKLETLMREKLAENGGMVLNLEQQLSCSEDKWRKRLKKLERQCSEFICQNEKCVKEANDEACRQKTENNHLKQKCLALKSDLFQKSMLEAEKQHLQESLLELKDQNEKMQNIVVMLRSEMESLQQSASQENVVKQMSSMPGKEIQMKDLQDELKNLKAQVKNMVMRDGNLKWKSNSTFDDVQSIGENNLIGRITELEEMQAKLRAQLESTVVNAERIADERDLLMELNNSLHADLSRMQGACTHHHFHKGEGEKLKHMGLTCHDTACKNRQIKTQDIHHAAPPQSIDICPKCAALNLKSEASSFRECFPDEACGGPGYVAFQSKLHVEGNAAKYHGRSSTNPVDDVTHKGTPSQRGRLRSLSKRHEELHSSKPKIRNYNIKDDS